MGTWSDNPWDNDTAADWFGDLMDATGLRQEWHRGITAGPDEDDGQIRYAAAWLFVQLGRIYVWPIDSYGEDLEATIRVLQELRADDWLSEADPEGWVTRIDRYLAELGTRRPAA